MKALVSLVCVTLLVVSASAEVRTWKDKTGKFSIRAELVELDGTKVTLKKADGKVIKVPVDRLSDEDRQFLESQEKNAFSDSPSPSDAAKSVAVVKASGLRYGWKAGKSYTYQVKIEVDAGDDVLEFTGTPAYTVVSADKDKTVLSFRGTLMEFERSKSGRPPMPPGMPRGMMPGMMPGMPRGAMGPGGMGPPIPRMMHPFSPMTGVGPMGMARTTELTVDPLGNIARQEGTSQLPFLLGNLSYLMIEPLPATEEQSWTVAHGSGVVIKEGGPPRFGPFANDEGFVPARVKTVYTIESQTDKQVVIRKQYEFLATAAGNDKPPFEISGDGKWTFNKLEGASGDLDFKMKVTIRKGSVGVEIPVKATYHLLDEAKQAKLAKESKEGAEKAKKMLADRAKPPSSDELKSLVADLESGEMHRVMPTIMKLTQKKPKEPNRAVAKALERILAEDDNIGMRINAAHALVNWGTKESLPALKGVLKDSNPILKRYAKQAIKQIESRSGSAP